VAFQFNVRRIIFLIPFLWLISSQSEAQSKRDMGSYIMIPNVKYATNKGYKASLNMMDVYMPKKGSNSPVIVYIHGGSWESGDKEDVHRKPEYFTSKGYIFISINYRQSPDVKHPVLVQDVADALVYVYNNIKHYSGDKDHIFLMGYSAGAHLAALVSTDSQYMEKARGSIGMIKASILIDGDGYDIPTLMPNAKGKVRDWYKEAFGSSRRDWVQASPVTYIKSGKEYPQFLIMYAGVREDSEIASKILERKLHEAGVVYKIKDYPKENHSSINRTIGKTDDRPTLDILNFLLDIISPYRAIH
jgi:arylformamidase